ncbi:DUF7669 domain-containing protein [Tepidibacter sp. Z1-5]|uniref:DUF7669 domain-containing protein n=1 Tax=Tepidibacter sp. Z1-5 TaxID=3134138 RepID=UPI0030C078CC
MNKKTTCRDELLYTIKQIINNKGVNEFTVKEVVDYMKSHGSTYKESTIRTHITSRCCINVPNNHETVYDDYERIDKGIYRIINM